MSEIHIRPICTSARPENKIVRTHNTALFKSIESGGSHEVLQWSNNDIVILSNIVGIKSR